MQVFARWAVFLFFSVIGLFLASAAFLTPATADTQPLYLLVLAAGCLWIAWTRRPSGSNMQLEYESSLEDIHIPQQKKQSVNWNLLDETNFIMDYMRSDGEVSEREIDVYSVNRTRNGDLTLIAYCHLRNEQRTFRVDRILSLASGSTGEIINDPEEFFDLQHHA